MAHLTPILLTILFAPLVGALIAGILGKKIGQVAAHTLTTALVGVSMILSLYVFKLQFFDQLGLVNVHGFNWINVGKMHFQVGLYIDKLTALMLVVVTVVSFLVHIYSIGYMQGDKGYARFFSYISGFTFSMLSLVMANGFLLLFFGWEAVGLFSYLLIGFWFHREKANHASLKAFLANRVGDLGFMLGVAGVLMFFGHLDYASVFKSSQVIHVSTMTMQIIPGVHWSALTVICLLLFIGAVGKSAQIPLHIWLEGSMEGPTPISALIHAATMVTAGVFMVARLSPLFEYSAVSLSTVLIIGAVTAFLMGLVAVVQMDIKRVVAFSTLSQLGYMMAAQGVSAYDIGMFHLMTHAAFKSLLFLAAGSVIIAMHHEQDMRKMGGLYKYMPITYVSMLVGALSISAIPPFSGFYSKDLIIDAVHLSTIYGHQLAYYLLLGGAFITSIYTFRMFFLTFHGSCRVEPNLKRELKESPLTITIPLMVLLVLSIVLGYPVFSPVLKQILGHSVFILPQHNVLSHLAGVLSTPILFAEHSVFTPVFWLSLSGIIITFVCYVLFPAIPGVLATRFSLFYTLLTKKFLFDDLYEWLFGKGSIWLGTFFWKKGDELVIDEGIVHGSAKACIFFGRVFRRMQTGYLYHYVLVMVLGLVIALGWFFVKG